MIIKTFFNWTSTDFSYPYGGEIRTFRAGSSRDMEGAMADFFAKHLADWQMDEQKIPAGQRAMHKEFMDKCFLEESAPVTAQVAADAIINQEMPKAEPIVEKKKMGRPPSKKIEEFEGVDA